MLPYPCIEVQTDLGALRAQQSLTLSVGNTLRPYGIACPGELVVNNPLLLSTEYVVGARTG